MLLKTWSFSWVCRLLRPILIVDIRIVSLSLDSVLLFGQLAAHFFLCIQLTHIFFDTALHWRFRHISERNKIFRPWRVPSGISNVLSESILLVIVNVLFVILDSTPLFKFYLILLSQFKLVQRLTEHVLSADCHGLAWVVTRIWLIQDAAYATLCIRSAPQIFYAALSICVLHTFSMDVTLRDKALALGIAIAGQFRIEANSYACSLASYFPIFSFFVDWSSLSNLCASWINICAFQLIKFRVQSLAMHLGGVHG